MATGQNLSGTTSSAAGGCAGSFFVTVRLHHPERLARHRARSRRLCLGSHPVLRHGRRRLRQCPSRSAGNLAFSSSTQTGWAAGAGIEAAISPNWTVKVDPSTSISAASLALAFRIAERITQMGGGVPTNVSLTENIIRAGVNFKFW